jgi:spermidine synthase
MKKWVQLEEVAGPNGTKLTLHTHDNDYAIRVNGRELMSSRHHYSEEQLAVVACAPLTQKKGVSVLIGGLGLGFTLRAALATLGPDARVVVAELMPEIITWNQNHAYNLAAAEIADPRTTIEIGDVADIIGRSRNEFDAIMLDADNETTAMNTAGNSSLYEVDGLARVHAALRPKAHVVYWSAGADPRFAKKMGKNGFDVEVQRARVSPTSHGTHVLLIGRKR